MAQRDATVNLRVTEDRKERWTEAVEEQGLSSLADLIRLSVENELADDAPAEPSDGGSTPDLAPVEDRLDTLDERLATTVNRLDDVADAVADLSGSSSDDGDEASEATAVTETDVFETLPTRDEVMQPIKTADGWTNEGEAAGATAVDVAEELDAPVGAVEQTLRQLNLRTERVQYTEQDGVRFYVKNV